jgi:hypothetical protein
MDENKNLKFYFSKERYCDYDNNQIKILLSHEKELYHTVTLITLLPKRRDFLKKIIQNRTDIINI